MGEKMNDNEIITAWKCCSNVITSSCKECPLHLTYNANCVRELMRVSLDLYNRLKAENFNLKEEVKHFQLKNSELFKLNNSLVEENDYRKSENERLKAEADMADGYADALEAKAKSEAYREFAEKFKWYVTVAESKPTTRLSYSSLGIVNMIDLVYKELTESNE